MTVDRRGFGKSLTGILGAANPNGIPTDYITQMKATYVSPLVNGNDPGIPPFRSKTSLATAGFDVVYMPYCTGDVHTGNNVADYASEAGTENVEFHHDGHNATQAITEWIDENFTHIPKLFVTGCSAGGVGSVVNYHFFRKGIRAVEKGYMLDDSGPVFPSTGYSAPLHAKMAMVPGFQPSCWDASSTRSMSARSDTRAACPRVPFSVRGRSVCMRLAACVRGARLPGSTSTAT